MTQGELTFCFYTNGLEIFFWDIKKYTPRKVLGFAYTYEKAVNNVPPYLCDFQVMKIQTKFQAEGIGKRTISLEDQKTLLLEGKEVAELNFDGSQLEKQIINKGTNALIVKEFNEILALTEKLAA